jgi:predicted nucleotidyltransferase
MRHQRVQQTIRQRLLEDALQFVCTASRLPGVVRIALLGSLATEKPEPKDVDLLITVTDGADLTPIAGATRRLQGHAQSYNRGADVFVTNPLGHYLGRICHWKRCAPGIRVSCDALHCGRRPFLHDDLATIQLAPELVLRPPLDLFPDVIRRVPLPADVETMLIRGVQEVV